MIVRERVPFSELTTFKSGGPARFVVDCASEDDVREAIARARTEGVPFYVLGEGSNVLLADAGFEGLVLRVRMDTLTFEDELLIGDAGVSWDRAVAEAASRGLWGIENLAGIPGTLGAAPVQNIGAYGVELRDVFAYADVFDAQNGEVVRLEADACAFGYRDSRFKHEPNLIILRVALRLSHAGTPKIEYGDLKRAQDAGIDLSSPASIGAAVREIRKGKFPDLAVYGTAGSFFKNPIVSEETYATLAEKYGDVPRFPNPHGVKIPLAFVLDRVLGMRGFRLGNAWLFGNQPLVLVLDAEGKSADVEALAREVESRVHEATGITIDREVRTLA